MQIDMKEIERIGGVQFGKNRDIAHALRILDDSGLLKNDTTWRPITGGMRRKVLVTNNIDARTASGEMSHVWIAEMVHEEGGRFTAFNNKNWDKIENLTHYAELPMPTVLD